MLEAGLMVWESWTSGRTDHGTHRGTMCASRPGSRATSFTRAILGWCSMSKLLEHAIIVRFAFHIVLVVIDDFGDLFGMFQLVLLCDALHLEHSLPVTWETLTREDISRLL